MRLLPALLLVMPSLAHAAQMEGDVVVVEDATGEQHSPGLTGLALKLCTFGARELYTILDDEYDAVFVFSTHPMNGLLYISSTTPAGYPVRQADTGVVYGSTLIPRPPSEYGSASTLKHCVYMGPMRNVPEDPDGPSDSFGTPGLKAIDVVGHEFGHHWLVGWAFDQGDGPKALHRSNMRDMPDADPISSSSLHYSTLADSHSVMYGSFITPMGNGQFLLEGGTRKYGLVDQYLMGLRGADETPPLLVIDDGSHLGKYDSPLAPGQSTTESGTAVMVSVDDIVRAQGPRNPAYPNAQNCWRVAFVLVTEQGHTVTPDELAKVEAYRQRWATWFPEATDGRGRTDTRLIADDACPAVPIGVDAGQPVAVPDASISVDAAMAPVMRDAAVSVETHAGPGDDTIGEDGCGCSATSEKHAWWALVLVLLRRKRHGGANFRLRRVKCEP